MSLLKFYSALSLVPFTINALRYPYEKWKYWNMPKEPEWDTKTALANFAHLSQSTPENLHYKICSKNIVNMAPYLHQGHLGLETKEEADAAIETIVDIGGLAAGLSAILIPVVMEFSNCHSNNSLGVCTKASAEDLLTFSGLRLLTAAYLVSALARIFFIRPTINTLARDPFPNMRVLLIAAEYGQMLGALTLVLEKPDHDPQFLETVKHAKQFLKLLPQIEQEIHRSVAIDKPEVKKILYVITVTCKQIVLKATAAPPLPSEPPKETRPQPLLSQKLPQLTPPAVASATAPKTP